MYVEPVLKSRFLLSDFEPFDLEGWWGKKLYKNLTQSNN